MELGNLAAVVATVITSMGGWECVKYMINRRFNARREEASTDEEEFRVLAETNTWLQRQLQQKEERFAEQTKMVRKLNTEVLELTRGKAEAELELQKLRCMRQHCESRQPQNGY